MMVKIICGISGSGKSTYCKSNFPDAKVCSADHYFMDDGEYKFDPRKLPEAHGSCLRKFVDLLQSDGEVVVDNTNTTISEVAPYAQLALAYGHDLEIIILDVDPEVAHKRNLHGVPEQGVKVQHSRLVKLAGDLPPWWPTTTVK